MPEHFDCASCEVPRRESDLWPENAEAVRVYGVLFSRVAQDCGLSAWVLEGFLGDIPGPERVAVAQRLDVIHRTFAPVERHG